MQWMGTEFSDAMYKEHKGLELADLCSLLRVLYVMGQSISGEKRVWEMWCNLGGWHLSHGDRIDMLRDEVRKHEPVAYKNLISAQKQKKVRKGGKL